MRYGELNAFGQGTLIVAYVNCGRSFQVYDNQTYRGKPIKQGYGSHYARVTPGTLPVPRAQLVNYKDPLFDEYVVPTGNKALPRFCVTFTKKQNVVIWRDRKLSNVFNSGVMHKLRKSYVVYGAETTKATLEIVKTKQKENKVIVVTDGADDSEELIKSIRNILNVLESSLIFSSSREIN
eukprot:UN09034